jgi:hypothetical protein
MENEMSDHIIPPSLVRYIATRDKRIEYTIESMTIRATFLQLLNSGSVIVGGRATAGTGNMTSSWRFFMLWNDVIDKARRCGYVIDRTSIPDPKRSNTGGYWYEYEYRVKSVPGCAHGERNE